MLCELAAAIDLVIVTCPEAGLPTVLDELRSEYYANPPETCARGGPKCGQFPGGGARKVMAERVANGEAFTADLLKLLVRLRRGFRSAGQKRVRRNIGRTRLEFDDACGGLRRTTRTDLRPARSPPAPRPRPTVRTSPSAATAHRGVIVAICWPLPPLLVAIANSLRPRRHRVPPPTPRLPALHPRGTTTARNRALCTANRTTDGRGHQKSNAWIATGAPGSPDVTRRCRNSAMTRKTGRPDSGRSGRESERHPFLLRLCNGLSDDDYLLVRKCPCPRSSMTTRHGQTSMTAYGGPLSAGRTRNPSVTVSGRRYRADNLGPHHGWTSLHTDRETFVSAVVSARV